MERHAARAVSISLPGIPAPVSGGDAGATPAELKRNTKLVGDISEVMVLAALVRAGYIAAKPFGENARYDLLADDGSRVHRIQVKTGRLRGGFIHYANCSSHAHRGEFSRPYFGQIDFLAVFCPQNGKVYLLPEEELTGTVAHLRLSPPKNNMRKRIRWAADFELL